MVAVVVVLPSLLEAAVRLAAKRECKVCWKCKYTRSVQHSARNGGMWLRLLLQLSSFRGHGREGKICSDVKVGIVRLGKKSHASADIQSISYWGRVLS